MATKVILKHILDEIYGVVRNGSVYYQITYNGKNSLDCLYQNSGDPITWHGYVSTNFYNGYAECGPVARNTAYKVRINIGGLNYTTTVELALTRGAHPKSGGIK